MPSGYEKSPDYGSPPPASRYLTLGALVFLCAAALIAWRMMPAAGVGCREVVASDVEVSGGKAVLRLDKLDLKPGECLRVAP